MTMVIDGKQTAKQIRAELREEAQRLGIVPGLCVILVGDDPASAIYVRNKARACKDAGFYSARSNCLPKRRGGIARLHSRTERGSANPRHSRAAPLTQAFGRAGNPLRY